MGLCYDALEVIDSRSGCATCPDEAMFPEMWDGLVGAWVPFIDPAPVGNNTVRNMVGRGPHLRVYEASRDYQFNPEMGRLYHYVSLRSYYDEASMYTPGFSLVTAVYTASTAGGTGGASVYSSTGTGFGWRVTYSGSFPGYMRIGVRTDGDSAIEYDPKVAISTSTTHTVVARFDGTTGTIASWDIDGAFESEDSHAVSNPGLIDYSNEPQFTLGAGCCGVLVYDKDIGPAMARVFGRAGQRLGRGLMLPFIPHRRKRMPGTAGSGGGFSSFWAAATQPNVVL